MKKILFLLPCICTVNFMIAQGLTRNGAIVTEAVVNTLKVGTVTYPSTNGTLGQVLTTDNEGNATWNSVSNLATVIIGYTVPSVTDLDSGKIICLLDSYNLSESLSDGFTCTFINRTTNSLLINLDSFDNSHFFFSNFFPAGEVTTVNILGGGTVRLNVIYVEGVMRYYVSGDILNPA